jgi:mannose-6-phosphate isomerase-like protein (cupin superfamily)
MSRLIRASELPGPPDGRRFIGADHGSVPISLFLVDARLGSGPQLHRHPYSEIFVVEGGRAEFQVGDTHLRAIAGDILIAPAGAPHRFTSIGNTRLRLTAIHTASAMDTEWLAVEDSQTPTNA